MRVPVPAAPFADEPACYRAIGRERVLLDLASTVRCRGSARDGRRELGRKP